MRVMITIAGNAEGMGANLSMLVCRDTDKNGLSCTLDPIKAYEERRCILVVGILPSMHLQSLEDEGYAVFRLVVEDSGHAGGGPVA